MLIKPPSAPSRATGAIEALLVELGHAQLDPLDEEDEQIAEAHDDLFEEVAAFARRGWLMPLDAKCEPDDDTYQDVLGALLAPIGVTDVAFGDRGETVLASGDHRRELAVGSPKNYGKWLDVDWIVLVATRALEGRGWRLVTVGEGDPTDLIYAVVPDAVWRAVSDRDLAGSWGETGPDPDPDPEP